MAPCSSAWIPQTTNQTKKKTPPCKQLWGIWEKDAQKTQAAAYALDSFLAVSHSGFPEQTLTHSFLVGFPLTWSDLIKKKKKINKKVYVPASLPCLQWLSTALVMVGIKPIKIRLQKSIHFFTFHSFVGINAACSPQVPSLSNDPIYFFDLCKLKQVWSSLGSELWLHLLVKLFIQAIPTL